MTAHIKSLVALASLAILLLGTNGYGYGIGYEYVGTQAEAEYNEGVYHLSENSPTSQEVVCKTPTFKELRDFILRDPTSGNEFVLNQYECRHFATDVNNNAEANDLRCAFVLLCYDRGQHAVVAFDNSDLGLVCSTSKHQEVNEQSDYQHQLTILTLLLTKCQLTYPHFTHQFRTIGQYYLLARIAHLGDCFTYSRQSQSIWRIDMAWHNRKNGMLTTNDIAHLLNTHVNTVRRWSDQRLLKAYRIGPRGDRPFKREDIDSFLLQNYRVT